eukprot:TRINITY_DN7396_c1_g1_i1.p1 TRINITY_DN7396_c1_g1~~TRINITY_DN7396_c1_g1_i1.p1  ORF type:complete len:260 (+),score=58.31 TRINITY_DN7396_c1_g1_i1:103-882(+)
MMLSELRPMSLGFWLGAAVFSASAAFLLWRRRRQDSNASSLPDTSVPEALHTLARGEPRSLRAAAARAIAAIMNGEVQVLEEVLDEEEGKHPEFGGRLPDGRGVLGVVLDDLASGGGSECEQEAFADLLLQCTYFDSEWDETDEWNELALRAVSYLQKTLKAEARVAAAEKNCSGPAAIKASVLRRRLQGDRKTTIGASEDGDTPGMLSMNTRVTCPVCMTMKPDMLRCPRCRNVGYCCAEHMRQDAERHSCWCFAGSG